jgi:hypothetical protein
MNRSFGAKVLRWEADLVVQDDGWLLLQVDCGRLRRRGQVNDGRLRGRYRIGGEPAAPILTLEEARIWNQNFGHGRGSIGGVSTV